MWSAPWWAGVGGSDSSFDKLSSDLSLCPTQSAWESDGVTRVARLSSNHSRSGDGYAALIGRLQLAGLPGAGETDGVAAATPRPLREKPMVIKFTCVSQQVLPKGVGRGIKLAWAVGNTPVQREGEALNL